MNPSEQSHLLIAAATHPGMRGKSNEDRYSVLPFSSGQPGDPPSVLAILADGIGGHRAGEVAAQLAVDIINRYVVKSPPTHPAQVLSQAFTHANLVIRNRSNEDSTLSGMGTTCVCAWVIGDQLYAASAGDSRLYLLRGKKLICLTTDHTWIQEALAQGLLTPDQARGHPSAHIIRRFLGSMNGPNPDMRLRLHPFENDIQSETNQGMRLYPGNRLMLCSDGLTDLVKDEEIRDILQTNQLESIPAQLINLANQRGGHDNITVVTLEVLQPSQSAHPSRVPPAQKASRSLVSWLMIGLLLVAILLMVWLLVYTYML